ncbi:MAG TPA: class I SAM-dependent methyltransferase [Acidimicrobiales bacterium]|nr:class I SAM-dependent methyltransferase [Acidimicrobiales bacterium]
MLTVRYDKLGVQPGDRLLDLGAGAGRHAFEAMRRGAVVTALDADAAEVKDAAWMMRGLRDEDRQVAASGGRGAAMVANARHLPFPDAAFDRIIAAEVLEHIPGDRPVMAELARVLRPGGTMAVTVPRWWPELVTWAISDEYHDRPGGHIRIYRRSALESRIRQAGLERYGSHHAHALHTPYWWLRAAVGVDRQDHPLVQAYHRMLVWDITAHTVLTRVPESVLNPVMGKSLVMYFRKPA